MTPPPDQWPTHTRHTLKRYDEALLRQVAHKLCKPRNQWPVHELLDRVTAALANPPMIDRRLKELPAACRQILAVMGRSRQTRWPVGSLVEILVALGAKDGLAPLVALLESGLLLPELFAFGTDPEEAKTPHRAKVKNFAAWLARAEPMPLVLAPPAVTKRVLGEDLGITCPETAAEGGTIHEADGFDWPLRLAVLWQQTLDAPIRRTQQGDFFKRDFDRLKSDPLLSAAPTDALTPLPDPGFLAGALASASGLLNAHESELRAGDWPAAWRSSLPHLIAELWRALPRVATWNPATGHVVVEGAANPYGSAYLLAVLLLSRLSEKSWASPQAIEDWIVAHHPFWAGKTGLIGIGSFLLGVAYSLRLVQTTKASDGGWLVRLSPLGRWLMALSDEPPALPGFQQTLLVQPNLEILAYRQGLTPELIVSLSKIATWKTLGPACTLQLEPHSVYRALEMGESLSSITHLLEAHGMKAIPSAVLDSLKTWSSKRERIGIYASGAIFEFASSAEMSEAIARGLPATRLTDRLAIVADEAKIDYKHFRLTGTRDYTLPPEKCVDVEPDGVTLSVDLARSDLLLETELQRFAELAPVDGTRAIPSSRRYYRLTPASIAAARQKGVSQSYLETWFAQRTGLPISAAALLLMTAHDVPPVEMRRQIVVHVATEHLADGLAQWPGTSRLVRSRLGPTTLVVDDKDVTALAEQLKQLGARVLFEG
jgi:hypothetical protein